MTRKAVVKFANKCKNRNTNGGPLAKMKVSLFHSDPNETIMAAQDASCTRKNLLTNEIKRLIRRCYMKFPWFLGKQNFLFVFKKIEFFSILDRDQRNTFMWYYSIIDVYYISYEKDTHNLTLLCMLWNISISNFNQNTHHCIWYMHQ